MIIPVAIDKLSTVSKIDALKKLEELMLLLSPNNYIEGVDVQVAARMNRHYNDFVNGIYLTHSQCLFLLNNIFIENAERYEELVKKEKDEQDQNKAIEQGEVQCDKEEDRQDNGTVDSLQEPSN